MCNVEFHGGWSEAFSELFSAALKQIKSIKVSELWLDPTLFLQRTNFAVDFRG